MINRADTLNIVPPEEPSFRIKKVLPSEKVSDKPKNLAETELQKSKSDKGEKPIAETKKNLGDSLDIFA